MKPEEIKAAASAIQSATGLSADVAVRDGSVFRGPRVVLVQFRLNGLGCEFEVAEDAFSVDDAVARIEKHKVALAERDARMAGKMAGE